MKHITVRLAAAAIVLAAVSALGGCSGSTDEIDLSLLGGEAATESRTDSVDIRHDSSENEESEVSSTPEADKTEAPVNSDTISGAGQIDPIIIEDPENSEPVIEADHDDPKEETSPDEEKTDPDDGAAPEDDITDPEEDAEENDPAVTVTTDRKVDKDPDQTQPIVTTANTTTQKQERKDPQEVELDEDGFPENPVANQKYQDPTGQWWIYNSIFGWGESDGIGATIMEDFPDNYGEIGSGKKILF